MYQLSDQAIKIIKSIHDIEYTEKLWQELLFSLAFMSIGASATKQENQLNSIQPLLDELEAHKKEKIDLNYLNKRLKEID